jgi:hypothetical protein
MMIASRLLEETLADVHASWPWQATNCCVTLLYHKSQPNPFHYLDYDD